MTQESFATVINCIDGRAQTPVTNWVKEHYHVDYVDDVTEPGPDKVLCEGPQEEIESIKKKVMVSVNAHHSRVVAVACHHDCAGNPVTKEEHCSELRRCVEVVKSWKLPVDVIGLWVNDKWGVEVIPTV